MAPLRPVEPNDCTHPSDTAVICSSASHGTYEIATADVAAEDLLIARQCGISEFLTIDRFGAMEWNAFHLFNTGPAQA
jgi:hypothetical protein